MTYRPKFLAQLQDPTTTLDGFLCTLESAAMALDFQTGGRVQKWGGQLVPWCGRSPEEIRQKGTNLQNAEQAVNHFGGDLDIRDGPWSDVIAELRKGNLVILQGDYDQLPNATSCQDTFEANHAVVLLPELDEARATVLSGDPLCGGFRWTPQDEWRAYAEDLALTQRGTRSRLFYAISAFPMAPDTGTEDVVVIVDRQPFAIPKGATGTNITGWLPDGRKLTEATWTGLVSASASVIRDDGKAPKGAGFVVGASRPFTGYLIPAASLRITEPPAPDPVQAELERAADRAHAAVLAR